jgi:predicted HicB family RNase H-like nuclease
VVFTITYKTVIGYYDFEQGDDMMHGSAAGITDMVHFCGKTHEEVYTDFIASIEEYLAFCQELGQIPQISLQ